MDGTRWTKWLDELMMPKNSSNCSALSCRGSIVVLYNVYYWLCTAVSPLSVAIGIPMSLLIIGCMPSTSINRKPKMFYVLFAACNLSPLVLTHLLLYFCTMLYHVSDGQLVPARFDVLSSSSCRLSRFMAESAESCTSYLMAFYSIQRLIAISSPFRAKLFTMRRSVVISICIVIPDIAINSLAFYAYSLDAKHMCSPNVRATGLVMALFILNHVLPNVLLLISVSLTLIALKLASSQYASSGSVMSRTSKLTNEKRVTASRTTAVLLLLASIRCSVYVPFSVFYVTWQFIPNFSTSAAVRIVSNYFKILSGLTCIADFIVYATRIPDFRAQVHLIRRCRARL